MVTLQFTGELLKNVDEAVELLRQRFGYGDRESFCYWAVLYALYHLGATDGVAINSPIMPEQ